MPAALGKCLDKIALLLRSEMHGCMTSINYNVMGCFLDLVQFFLFFQSQVFQEIVRRIKADNAIKEKLEKKKKKKCNIL
jgi:hypothetical protein